MIRVVREVGNGSVVIAGDADDFAPKCEAITSRGRQCKKSSGYHGISFHPEGGLIDEGSLERLMARRCDLHWRLGT